MPLRIIIGLMFCGLLATQSHAARPMITDDARIVERGACQIETWLQGYRDRTEYWAVPGCGVTDWLEVSAGGSWLVHHHSPKQHDSSLLQFKGLFKALPDGVGWGAGLAGGVRSGEANPADFMGSQYLYLPISYAPIEGVVFHVNPGWQRVKKENEYWQSITWGVGTEIDLHARLQGIAETFGDERNSFYQAGVRVWLVPDRVQIDTTYGNNVNGGEAWWTVGLRLISGRFF